VTTEPINWDWEAAWAKTEPPANAHPIQLKPENVDNVAGNWITAEILMQAAVHYATNGMPVFPCQPWDGAYSKADAKAPLTRNGFHDATTEISVLRIWWQQFPFAMIGSPVPPAELCLDIDPRSGGDRWALVELAGIAELPVTRMVLSGRYDGGHHLFFQRPHGQLDGTRLKRLGIDIRVGGKHYTVLPPSVHDATGGRYLWRWNPDAPAAPLPAEVAALLIPPTPQPTAVSGDYKPSSKALAGILRKVGENGEGSHNRQNIGFWAAGKLLAGNYPLEAWDAVEGVLRTNRATNHDVRTALRERPDGKFVAVHA
jgi:hypothetical protein